MTTFIHLGPSPPEPALLRPVQITEPEPEPPWEAHWMEISPSLGPWFRAGVALVPNKPIGVVLSVADDARQPPTVLIMAPDLMLRLSEAIGEVAAFALSIQRAGALGEEKHREAS